MEYNCHKNSKHSNHMVLAMAYVPWQHWNQVYCPEEGLACGTIFPELKKPFLGKAGCHR